MHAPPSWPQRFLAGLVPWSDRAMVLLVLAMVFLCGMIVHVSYTTSRIAEESERRISEALARGPTLSQRLDALDARMRLLEEQLRLLAQRLAP
jgi:hypothetical protein